MSDLIDISHLHKEFKNDVEQNQFIEAQQKTIVQLQQQIHTYKEELARIKRLLSEPEDGIERVILSPEEALVSDQIMMIQERSYAKELSLEDVKKLDILLKHKKSFKDEDKTLKADSKKVYLSNEELLKLVQKP